MNRRTALFRDIVTDARHRLADHESLRQRCCDAPAERVVHDFRITTRRLLASLALLASELPEESMRAGRKFLKHQLQATSKLRDLQVHRDQIGELAIRRPALQALARKLAQKEERAAARMAAKLTRPGDLRRRDELERTLAALPIDADGATLDVRATLQRAFARFDRLRRASDRDLKRLHRLRVALKRYRYMREAAAVAPEAESDDSLRRAQRCLGQLHDLALLEKRIRKHARRQANREPWRECLRRLGRRRASRMRRQRRLVAAICLPHRPQGKPPAGRRAN